MITATPVVVRRSEAIFVFALASAWRLVAAWQVKGYALDEAIFGIPTVRDILAGNWPLHFVKAPYGFPLNEWLAAPLFLAFGPHPMWLRLPSILVASIVIAWVFVQLARQFGRPVAWTVGLLVGCPHGLHLIFVSLGSSYGTGFAVIALAVSLLARLKLNASMARFAWIGSATGWLHFILPQLRVFLLAWALYILGPHLWRLVQRYQKRPIGRVTMALACLGALMLALAGYHFLTRRGDPMPNFYRTIWLLGGGLLLAAGIGVLRQPSWQAIAKRWSAFLAFFVLATLPLDLAYRHWQKDRLEVAGAHDASQYSLKHAHEWPAQVAFFVGRIVPLALGDRSDSLTMVQVKDAAIPPAAIAGGIVLLALWGWAVLRQIRQLPSPSQRIFLAWVLPVGLTAILILPSWNLAHDLHARYFTLVAPGLWLPWAIQLQNVRQRLIAPIAMILLLAWNAYDAFVIWPEFWNERAISYAEIP